MINTYISLMYLKKIGKLFTSKFVRTGPSSYNKRSCRAAVSQRLRNTALYHWWSAVSSVMVVRLH